MEDTATTQTAETVNEPLTIRDAVSASLGALSGRTRALVIEHFAEKEAGKQADALVKGLEKLNDLEREKKRLDRPDIESFNSDGSTAATAFSKERIEQRKKLTEQIDKLVRSIAKADDKADFGDLYNLVK